MRTSSAPRWIRSASSPWNACLTWRPRSPKRNAEGFAGRSSPKAGVPSCRCRASRRCRTPPERLRVPRARRLATARRSSQEDRGKADVDVRLAGDPVREERELHGIGDGAGGLAATSPATASVAHVALLSVGVNCMVTSPRCAPVNCRTRNRRASAGGEVAAPALLVCARTTGSPWSSSEPLGAVRRPAVGEQTDGTLRRRPRWCPWASSAGRSRCRPAAVSGT